MSYVSGFHDCYLLPQSAGASSAAQSLDKQSRETYLGIKFGGSKARSALDQLHSVGNEYGLLGTFEGIRTHSRASDFLASLAPGTQEPDISVDPDGEIAFDWQRGDHLLSISIAPSGYLSIAERRNGQIVAHGSFFGNVLPDDVAQALESFR